MKQKCIGGGRGNPDSPVALFRHLNVFSIEVADLDLWGSVMAIPGFFEVLDEELSMTLETGIRFWAHWIEDLYALMLQIKANGVEVSALICRVLWSKLLEHREHDLQTEIKNKKKIKLPWRVGYELPCVMRRQNKSWSKMWKLPSLFL